MAQTPESITAASLNILRRFIFADSMVSTTERIPQMRAVGALGSRLAVVSRRASKYPSESGKRASPFLVRLRLTLLLAQRRATCTPCNLGRRKVRLGLLRAFCC